MGKFLRVLTVFIFLLTMASLTLASMLFAKREILKGRTQKLEQGLIKLARTLEAEPPAEPEDPETYPARDISDCTEEILETPTKSEFWNTYKQQLESLDQNIIDLNSRTRDLMSYYEIDPVTSKPKRHPVTNAKITDSENTTQGVIDYVIERAGAQYDILIETRQQLTAIRSELIDTINELNGHKSTLREKLAAIVELNNKIAELNNKIVDLQNQVAERDEEISRLQGDIANLQQEKAILEEENETHKLKIEEQKQIIQDLRFQIDADRKKGDTTLATKTFIVDEHLTKIAPGVKGTIASVDQDHRFVVMELTPEFVQELLSLVTNEGLPLIEMLVKRGEDKFITKVRISQLKKDQNLAIADILTDWQQAPIEKGDLIFLQ
jgi:vacuolar-type H+-ATPase subunit I/STV1